MRLSIIITTRNRPDQLQRLLSSISEQDFTQAFEIIINDQSDQKTPPNPPNKGTLIYIKDHALGISCGRNNAIKKASGDYLVILDDDITLKSNCLTKLDTLLNYYDGCSCLCGLIVNIEDGRPFSRYGNKKYRGQMINRYNFNRCLSSAIAIRRQAILELGLFDENLGAGRYFGGSEESDLVLRLLAKEHKVVCDSSYTVFHPRTDHQQMTTRDWLSKSYHYGLGRGGLFRKHLKTNPIWAVSQLTFSIILPLGVSLVSGLMLRPHQAGHHLFSSLGRMVGFFRFCGHTRRNKSS